jgi:required for meiotic nuclear division protein 1
MRISAYFLAEQIELPRLREAYSAHLIADNPSELFFRVDDAQYLYVFDYGVVVFANMADVDMSKNMLLFKEFCKNPLPEKMFDDFDINHAPDAALKFHFDSLTTPVLSESIIKITMFNLAQSVALDFFDKRGESLLSEIKGFTDQMEQTGAIKISRKNMVKFIGRTLNAKNKIIENLFIFDSPDQTWDDEMTNQVHQGLVRTFELSSRFKEVEYTFRVIEENLENIRELFTYTEGHKLEWVIIILILIEVIDMLISKLH